MARYTVGIDLGTTNCALAAADGDGVVAPVGVPQVVGPGETAERPTLPSFLLLPAEHEVTPAQSWLCNPAIDRTSQVLPWRGATREDEVPGGEKVSPVNASARYLAHLRAAWDDAHPDDPIEEQDVLITVPASFDAVAREP